MHRLAIVARLKPGAEHGAAQLIAEGPPFDPASVGFERHAVYLSATEVVFVFEGSEVELVVDELIADPDHWLVAAAFERWRPFVEGPPRIARVKYLWEREADGASAT